MTNEELDAISERAEKATPGPWGEVAESGEWWLSGPDIYDDAVMSTNDTEISQADVDFIAAARTDVPALVAEVRRLRGKLEAATASAEAAEKDANELRADNEMNNHYAGRALDAERKLAAMTARAEAAEADRAAVHAANKTLNQERRALLKRAKTAEKTATKLNNRLDVVAQRLIQAKNTAKTKTRQIIILRWNAEAKLATINKYASYYHDAITNYEYGGPRQPLDYAEWLAQQQSEAQP